MENSRFSTALFKLGQASLFLLLQTPKGQNSAVLVIKTPNGRIWKLVQERLQLSTPPSAHFGHFKISCSPALTTCQSADNFKPWFNRTPNLKIEGNYCHLLGIIDTVKNYAKNNWTY